MLDLTSQNLFYYMRLPQKQEVVLKKSELVRAVARSAGIARRDAEAAVDALAATVAKEFRSGRQVDVVGVGTFSPATGSARRGRLEPGLRDALPLLLSTVF